MTASAALAVSFATAGIATRRSALSGRLQLDWRRRRRTPPKPKPPGGPSG